jgi:hypothetical protein
MSPQISHAVEPSPGPIEMARASPAPPVSNHDRKAITSLNASGADDRREVDVLEEFDFDAFLNADEATISTQSGFFWQDHPDDKSQPERLINADRRNENQRQQLKAMQSHRCFSRAHIPTSGHGVSATQPQVMVLPATTRQWYGAQVLNLRRGLTDMSTSDGPIIPSTDDTFIPAISPSSDNPSDPTTSADGMPQPARATPDSEIDMCDSDSDSDMSWVDVPMAEPKSTGATKSSDTTVTTPTSDSKSARAGLKRRSTSSDSEWDFC